ncbi:unnamed protein product, partial [Trichogramma brassicae]
MEMCVASKRTSRRLKRGDYIEKLEAIALTCPRRSKIESRRLDYIYSRWRSGCRIQDSVKLGIALSFSRTTRCRCCGGFSVVKVHTCARMCIRARARMHTKGYSPSSGTDDNDRPTPAMRIPSIAVPHVERELKREAAQADAVAAVGAAPRRRQSEAGIHGTRGELLTQTQPREVRSRTRARPTVSIGKLARDRARERGARLYTRSLGYAAQARAVQDDDKEQFHDFIDHLETTLKPALTKIYHAVEQIKSDMENAKKETVKILDGYEEDVLASERKKKPRRRPVKINCPASSTLYRILELAKQQQQQRQQRSLGRVYAAILDFAHGPGRECQCARVYREKPTHTDMFVCIYKCTRTHLTRNCRAAMAAGAEAAVAAVAADNEQCLGTRARERQRDVHTDNAQQHGLVVKKLQKRVGERIGTRAFSATTNCSSDSSGGGRAKGKKLRRDA